MKTAFSSRRVIHALDFAIRAHGDQTRKNGTTLYITHPIGVAEIVHQFGGDETQIIAALLHDVIEDCEDYGYAEIEAEFGKEVADMVQDLTNTSKFDAPHLNRAQRKEMDAKRLATIPSRSQLVKLADIYYNINDLDGLDPGFIPKFLREKRMQIEAIGNSNEIYSDQGIPKTAASTLYRKTVESVQRKLDAY